MDALEIIKKMLDSGEGREKIAELIVKNIKDNIREPLFCKKFTVVDRVKKEE